MPMYSRTEKNLHIGVIAPYFQGDYMGEIINQIRHICETKHYHFSAIRTDGFGQYNLSIGLNMLDAVIVLRNAANPKLIEKIQNRSIPVVAIAHDYFPLDVPVITCDNALGAELAFDYLTQKGHSDLLYVGDITQYDLRKRYERFCELMKERGIACSSEQLICAPDTIFSGGLAAGAEYLQRNSRCTGVFCGAGHTAMGFIKKLEESGVHTPANIDVVAFDSIRLMNVLTPGLTYIDQNLDIIAQRCITTLEGMVHSSTIPTRAITIAPTLCTPENTSECTSYQGQDVLTNTNYTSALLNNSFEMTRDIVNSRLDKIMGVAPLFSQFMNYGVLSCIVKDKHGRQHLHTHKVFESTETIVISGSDSDYVCSPEYFPPRALRDKFSQDIDTWVHFPVICNKSLWGILSIAGIREKAHNVGSFASFTSFMDNVTFAYSMVLENSDLREELKQSEAEAPRTHRTRTNTTLPSLDWDLEKGLVLWSELALELLGFTTELEKNIYRNMEIFDRVHPNDEMKLREELATSLSQLGSMTTAVRLKNAESEYRYYSLQGEIVSEENARAVMYRCCLSLIN